MAAVEGLTKIPELRRRLLFTLALLAVYRMGCHIPAPGADKTVLAKFTQGAAGGLLGILNLFTGKAFENVSIFALGIMPYISASIIFQLLTFVSPQLKALSKEGDMGRRKINQYSRYATILIAIVQGIGVTKLFLPAGSSNSTVALAILTLTAGTGFIMWLGEQITDRGIGQGSSLIIFAGICAAIPTNVQQTLQQLRDGQITIITLALLLALMVVVVGFIIFVETGQRRIPIQYAKRLVGRRMFGGLSTHLPLKINTSGVIPPIFANSMLTAPIAILGYFAASPWATAIRDALQGGGASYYVLYVGLIVFFCFFYTEAVFNPVDVAENLKKYGGYVPGIRPGKNTSDYIAKVLSRITLGGAIYISAVCLLPDILIRKFNISFYFGGTTLLILVGVALDTVEKIQTFLLHRDYEGFMKNAKLRGRRG